MNEVVLGTVAGILMGPYGANVFDPRSPGTKENAVTLEVMRVVLAIGLFAIGVELPRSYMAKHAKGLAAMVIPTMTIGWVAVAGIIVLRSSHRTVLPHFKGSCIAYFPGCLSSLASQSPLA
jgi:sodium/hydrogen antiporter